MPQGPGAFGPAQPGHGLHDAAQPGLCGGGPADSAGGGVARLVASAGGLPGWGAAAATPSHA